MKVVILAGGLGTRLAEETGTKPKPMVEIGGRPILWHIMKYYSHYGFNEFVICLGYKGHMIKEYFANHRLHTSNVVLDFKNHTTEYLDSKEEPWKIHLIDTGDLSQTGGRLLRVKNYISADESFHFTYGDGLCDVDLNALVDFHVHNNLQATMTVVRPPGRYGAVKMVDSKIYEFREKPLGDDSFINGGFFVLNKSVFELLENDLTVWENEPLNNLAKNQQIAGFRHDGFWQAMDTLREKNYLDRLITDNKAPWIKW
jgi:glucose-1-phosphate cytidylyltransferase